MINSSRLMRLLSWRLGLYLCHVLLLWCAASQKTATKLSGTESQNKPFLLIAWLSQAFCLSARKLTRTDSLMGVYSL